MSSDDNHSCCGGKHAEPKKPAKQTSPENADEPSCCSSKNTPPPAPETCCHDAAPTPAAPDQAECCSTVPPPPAQKKPCCCHGGAETTTPPAGLPADVGAGLGSCCGLEEATCHGAAAPAYTCPMHPEVVANAPGTCPKCGMALVPTRPTADDPEQREAHDMAHRFWISLVPTLTVLFLAMGPEHFRHSPASGWVQAALTTLVVFWPGLVILRRAVRSYRVRHLNMFSLIGLGVAAAYGFSLFALLFPGAIPEAAKAHGMQPLYFEAAAAITTLVLLGQMLEAGARRKTGQAVRALLEQAPNRARRVRDGKEEDIPIEAAHKGDTLRVLPGEKVPVDGTVLEGATTIDESMITGEPIPVAKAVGSPVTGGTLNQRGSFLMRAEKVGAETLLARIITMVAEAQRSRAPIQQLADRVAAWFVQAVLAIAALAFLVWLLVGPEPRLNYALLTAVSVLIIACPCALGLATPVSIVVGVGRGARSGVLFKNARALEALREVDTLAIDKTGTLTEGRPRVTELAPAPGWTEAALLTHAAALEAQSEHPLAAAILAEARTRHLDLPAPDAFEALPGAGIVGTVGKKRVLVGKPRLLRDHGVTLTETDQAQARALCERSRTVVAVAVDGRFAGFIAIADPIKATTPDAVRDLRNLGLRLIMLTGDNTETAAAVARELGIDEFYAEIEPAAKAEWVRRLQSTGLKVAMAGDGVNDAPALAHAHIGIAMSTGTDVAIESAGITLLHGDLRGIEKAVRLSRATYTNIKQNLFFAFAYNAAGVPVAAGALYPLMHTLLNPMLASVAMSLSCLCLIGNALRLRNVRI